MLCPPPSFLHKGDLGYPEKEGGNGEQKSEKGENELVAHV